MWIHRRSIYDAFELFATVFFTGFFTAADDEAAPLPRAMAVFFMDLALGAAVVLFFFLETLSRDGAVFMPFFAAEPFILEELVVATVDLGAFLAADFLAMTIGFFAVLAFGLRRGTDDFMALTPGFLFFVTFGRFLGAGTWARGNLDRRYHVDGERRKSYCS